MSVQRYIWGGRALYGPLGGLKKISRMKKCCKCKKEKPFAEFYRCKSIKSGFHYSCKSCMKKRQAQYQRENPEKIKQRRERYEKTPENRYRKYKKGARRRGIAFSLSFDEFMEFWQKPCVYCNGQIETIGLDRVNNSLGYIMSNVFPCCSKCNYLKSGKTLDEFRRLVEHCKCISFDKIK